MSTFLNYPGYRNVFSCIQCEMSRVGTEEHCCAMCHSYACKHLVVDAFGETICFCCSPDKDEDQWPDWCFTMMPVPWIQGKNEG